MGNVKHWTFFATSIAPLLMVHPNFRYEHSNAELHYLFTAMCFVSASEQNLDMENKSRE